jgi:hypothetical protein
MHPTFSLEIQTESSDGDNTKKNWGMGGHQGEMQKDEWLTPPDLLRALGEFDLDPSSPIDRPWPTAKRHLTILDNGLAQDWGNSRVWLNPPYGRETQKWMRKMAEHNHGTALIFARTETGTWHDWVWPHASSILFLRGRINFYHVSGKQAPKNAGAPSALISYGRKDAEILKNCKLPGKWINLNNP